MQEKGDWQMCKKQKAHDLFFEAQSRISINRHRRMKGRGYLSAWNSKNKQLGLEVTCSALGGVASDLCVQSKEFVVYERQ